MTREGLGREAFEPGTMNDAMRYAWSSALRILKGKQLSSTEIGSKSLEKHPTSSQMDRVVSNSEAER